MIQDTTTNVTLLDADHDGVYTTTSTEFTETEAYRLAFYAVDNDGLTSRVREVRVTVGGGKVYLPLVRR